MKCKQQKNMSLLLVLIMALSMAVFTTQASNAAETVTIAAWDFTAAGAGAATSFPATSGWVGYVNNRTILNISSGSYVYVMSGDQLFVPTTSTPSGAVPFGYAITFTPNPQNSDIHGYLVMISTNGGITWNAVLDNQYIVSSLPLELQVKATAPGRNDSSVTTYNYTQAKLPMVDASKNSGAVIPGTTIELECSENNATIKFKINGGETQTYIGALKLDEGLFIGDPAMATITTWAEKSGYLPTDVTNYFYTKATEGNVTEEEPAGIGCDIGNFGYTAFAAFLGIIPFVLIKNI